MIELSTVTILQVVDHVILLGSEFFDKTIEINQVPSGFSFINLKFIYTGMFIEKFSKKRRCE